MRAFVFAAAAIALVLAVGAAAALGAAWAGPAVGAACAILAALGGWRVLRALEGRLRPAAPGDPAAAGTPAAVPGDRARFAAVRVLYLILAAALVVASLRAARG